MPIDPKAVKWDAPDPASIQWDDEKPKKPALMQNMQTAAAGALRGAGSIGATLMAPQDMLEDALTKMIGGKNGAKSRNDQRREDMTGAFKGAGIDTESLMFQGPKMATEVAGTLGAGPAVAGVLGTVPQIAARGGAPLLQAIATGGTRAGSMTGAAGLGVRTAGGAVAGGASAGLVNPDDALLGAVIGGAAPGVIQALGKGGQAVGSVFKSPSKQAAERLAKALDIDPQTGAAMLQKQQTMIPGSQPTVAQVMRTPQASTLERIVSESPGGAGLKVRYDQQNAARLAMLDAVAPTNPLGTRSAQQDFGTSALKVIRDGDKAAKGATSAAYQSLPQDEAAFYLPDLAAVRQQMFTSGSFAPRGAVDDAVNTAQRIGITTVPGVVPTRSGAPGQSLAQAVRKAGGLSMQNNGGLRGETAAMRGEFKNIIRKDGKSLDEMAGIMAERGFIADDSADTLIEAMKNEARGGRSVSTFDDFDRTMRAAQESAMGDAPGVQKIPQKVTLREFDDLRKDIGSAQREAAKAGRDREALALSKMKEAMDDRVNEVVRGDGQIDENLPIDWVNRLDDARKLKLAQVQKFRTGPQAEAFRTGSDGLPKMQGGEFAPKVWGNRPGIADDIQQFRKVADENPRLLGQFRSMVTTEGASTASAGGNLTSKFVKWVDNSLPGLKASFDPGQVKMLQRIAADIRRANVADAVGAAKGSPTFQNASNALSLGVLDSPALSAIANRVPFGMGATALGAVREPARERMARELANYLANPQQAANALMQLQKAPNRNLLMEYLPRTAPALAADR
jgi:hypothetical protein